MPLMNLVNSRKKLLINLLIFSAAALCRKKSVIIFLRCCNDAIYPKFIPKRMCFSTLTVLPRRNTAAAPAVAPAESARKPTGKPKR